MATPAETRDDPRLIEELNANVDHLLEVWNTDDSAAFASLFAHPWGMVTPTTGFRSMATPADTIRFHQEKMRELHAGDWAASAFDEGRLTFPLAENLGVVTEAWRRERPDGTVFMRGRSFYTWQRMHEGWKLVAILFN